MRIDHNSTTRKLVRLLAPALFAAPLLGSCSGGGVSVPPGGLTLPDCQDGQVLGYDASSKFGCLPAPVTNLSVPTCKAGEALTSEDSKTVICVPTAGQPTDATTLTRINTAEQKVIDAESTLTQLTASFRGKPSFVGVTTATYTGAITAAGKDKGIASAAALCSAQFADSHMCTAYEMATAAGADAAAGGLSGKTVAKSWIYFPSWNNPLANSTDPLQGQGDNCGQYTYDGTNLNWSGMTVEYGVSTIATGFNAMRFRGGTDAPCNVALPIACCK